VKIALVRHPAPLIEPGICYGRLDVAADPFAATPLGDPDLRDATWVWTSPARRCRGLAEAIAGALSVPLAVDPRLLELDFGEWEGLSWDAIAIQDLDRWAAAPLAFAPPGGESGAELLARVRDFHADLRRHQQNCVVVSHGGPLKLLSALLLGTPVDLLAPAPRLGSVRIIACPG
jgi:alpha-ribazole phosphatase